MHLLGALLALGALSCTRLGSALFSFGVEALVEKTKRFPAEPSKDATQIALVQPFFFL
jgi:peptide subunit release factor RF-3